MASTHDGRRLALYRAPVRPFGVDPARVWRPSDAGAVSPTVYLPILGNRVVPLTLKLAREAGQDAVGLAVLPARFEDLKKEAYGPGAIQVVTRDAVLTARIADGRFPRHRDVWPTGDAKAELRLDDASRLGDLLSTAVAATDSEHKGVEIVLAGGCLMMTVASGTKGKAVLSLLVPDSEDKATFELDALMFRQFLDAAGDERLRMRFYGEGQPLVLQAGPRHEFVLMPLTRDKPAPTPRPAVPEPEEHGASPVAPVGATPDAHEVNGKAH